MRTLFVCFASVLSLAAISDATSANALVGAKAPDFHAEDLDGTAHTLHDYRGKIIVLEWSSPECPYSRRYYDNGTLDALYEYASNNSIVWINIVPKLQELTPRQVKERSRGALKNIIIDSNYEISSLFDATTTPQIFIIDRRQTLSYIGAIDSSATLKKQTKELIPYTRNALEDLLAGQEVRKKITRAFGCYIPNSERVLDFSR